MYWLIMGWLETFFYFIEEFDDYWSFLLIAKIVLDWSGTFFFYLSEEDDRLLKFSVNYENRLIH
jgi:hypothetical protein